jgi:hypothetical protein
MNNVTQKTVKELSALGFNLIGFSSASRSSELVQTFIAKYKGLKVHAWFSVVKGAYEFTITK